MKEKFHGDCSFEGAFDSDGVQVSSGLDARGRELPDPVPMAVPVEMLQTPSLVDTIRRMLHSETLRARAAAEGFDSPEEADDFDIEDDPLDPLTPYEAHFMPDPQSPPPVPLGDSERPAGASDPAAGGEVAGENRPASEPPKPSVPVE